MRDKNMTDQYQTFAKSPIGKFVIKNLGLPAPTFLDRFESATPVIKGAVLLAQQQTVHCLVQLRKCWQMFTPIAMQVTMHSYSKLRLKWA
jgi:hypothetical protein